MIIFNSIGKYMRKFFGQLSYTNGSNDYLDVKRLLFIKNEFITFDMKTSWGEHGFWVCQGKANFDQQTNRYFASHVDSHIATDPKHIDEGIQIEFYDLTYDEKYHELDIKGILIYANDRYDFEGMLELLI